MQNIYSPGPSTVLLLDADAYERTFAKAPAKTYLGGLLPFLEPLPRRFLRLLECHASVALHKRNAKLFGHGQPCRTFFCLLNGELSISMPRTK